MRFLRVGSAGAEVPAAISPATTAVRDLSSITSDIDGDFLSDWRRHEELIGSDELPDLKIEGLRLGAPIARPQAIYAIGLNYRSHAAETELELPTEPLVFSKTPNSICGPYDDVTLPPGSLKGDWEVELGVVIGAPTYRLGSVAEAEAVIAGYVAANDVTERALQFDRGGQWLKGKSFPTANPIGPYLVTPEEVPDPGSLDLLLQVNGKTKQSGNTRNLVFSVPHIIWYLSQFVKLEPGDLINTGTPDGVGFGMRPPQYLADGDLIELAIAGIGTHRNRVQIPTS